MNNRQLVASSINTPKVATYTMKYFDFSICTGFDKVSPASLNIFLKYEHLEILYGVNS